MITDIYKLLDTEYNGTIIEHIENFENEKEFFDFLKFLCLYVDPKLIKRIPIVNTWYEEWNDTLLTLNEYVDGAISNSVEYFIMLKKTKLAEIGRFLNDDKVELLTSFEVPHIGREMDNTIWIVKSNGVVKYVSTNHGSLCQMTKDEILDQIDQMDRWVKNATNAMLEHGR